MRRVYREDCARPANWDDQVGRAFPDHAEFVRKAAEFEKLGLNSKPRRAGFSRFAPQVLVRRKGKIEFPAIWGKHKETIAAMSREKCVYCEVPINAPRAAHVEHFKPKALFPMSAYDWTNYFLGCPGCNGAKSNKWPRRGGYVRPDSGDPSRHFVFAEDGTVKAVRPNSAADRTLEDFDLKRVWLSKQRKLHIEGMLSVLNQAIELQKAGYRTEARNLARTIRANSERGDAAYSVALTQCFWRAWKDACPGVEI
jgi:uncharacterized protein (TIGR02646 family)